MRLTVCISSLLALSSPLLSSAQQQVQQQATRAYDFTESIGADTHFGYSDTAYYLQTAQVIKLLQGAGIHHVRDGLVNGWIPPQLYHIHAQLKAAGIHADLVLPNPTVATTPSKTTAAIMGPLLANYPDVEAVEAPNEYDLSNTPNWAANLKAYMPTVWQMGHQAGLETIGPSLQPYSTTAVGDLSSYMNFNNLHAYFGGRNPETGGWGGPDAQWHYYGSFAYDFDKLALDGPKTPIITTETGYVAGPTMTATTISEADEAIYEPRLLLHSWNLGVKRTYIYELVDDPSSTQGFGLIRKDLTQRPAYRAICNLTTMLLDGPFAFNPSSLSYTMKGATSQVETSLFQKSNGSFWLAIWLKDQLYDVNTLQRATVTPLPVELFFNNGRMATKMWVFTETGWVNYTTPNVADLTVKVGSGVTLIKIM